MTRRHPVWFDVDMTTPDDIQTARDLALLAAHHAKKAAEAPDLKTARLEARLSAAAARAAASRMV